VPGEWFARLERDWRVRTTVPIVALHVAAFIGIYLFTYQFAMNEIRGAFRVGAAYVRDEAANLFTDSLSGHQATNLRDGLAAVARAHKSTAIAIFSPAGDLSASVGAGLPFDTAGVKEAVAGGSMDTTWVRRDGERVLVTGVQLLRNEPACQGCHTGGSRVLGAIGVQRDLSERVLGTAGRLRKAVGSVFVGWFLLLGVSLAIRNRVIGRPLAQIEQTVLGSAGAEPPAEPNHDLESLAGRVHSAVWGVLERQQARSREMDRGMERVTQLAVLGDVAAGLSHEIKNPLAGIRAALSALRREDGLPPAERLEVVEEMISEVDRVNRTVDSLLSLARPRSPVRTPADLGRLVRRATALLEARARSRNVRLSVEVAPEVPSLELDSDLLIQVVVNLVTNALDAVKDGGRVRVAVEPFPGRDGAALAVTDDGEGIPQEVMARLFEPFFTTKRGGTGLGLPLCIRIVEQHGGTISVESEPGKGTTFLVLLPCRDVPVKNRK